MAGAVRFTGGRIWTGTRYVDSIVLAGGRVIAAGGDAAAPAGTEVVDLEGRLVVPGLIDAHLHLGELVRDGAGMPLAGIPSLAALAEALAAWGSGHPTGPIVGRGWSAEQFAEGREPTAADLDRSGIDRPVLLVDVSGHAAVGNRAALAAVGFGRTTPDPPGGRLGRAADGSPDGRLYETALGPLLRWVEEASPLSAPDLARTYARLNALGVTTVATMNTGPEELRWLAAAAGGPAPPSLRVRAYIADRRAEELGPADWAAGGRAGWLAVTGIKAFADGAFGPRTAWLAAPYSDRPEESGVPGATHDALVALFDRCAERGLQPAVHAIGDRAVAEVLFALSAVGHRAPPRPRIEHAGLVPPELVGPLRALGPTVVVQPGFLSSDAWLGERLGTERVRWAYPFGSLDRAGVPLAGSTDAPFDAVDPWRALRCAVDRVGPDGRSANPAAAEALPPERALDLFTRGAGRALREVDLGYLEPPARADLVVLRATDVADAIRRGAAAVDETWVGGRCVYRRDGPPPPG